MQGKITVNFESNEIEIVEKNGGSQKLPVASAEGFAMLSKAWLRCGWETKHVYSFTWQGRPVIQLPEDLIRIQEIIYRLKPDLIVETGIAHGGSLIFYASLCALNKRGRVVGVDIEIRPHNRMAIEQHELSKLITLVEGDSVSPEVVRKISGMIRKEDVVLVLLDACHTQSHVLAELRAYSAFVSLGSYIVATDGIMQDVVGAARTSPDWEWNNPISAMTEFLDESNDFVRTEPAFEFNEGLVSDRVTYWPKAFLQRVKTSKS